MEHLTLTHASSRSANPPNASSPAALSPPPLAMMNAVFGVTDQGIEGAYAEKLAIKAAIIAKKPDRLGHTEAAAMALTSPAPRSERQPRKPAPA